MHTHILHDMAFPDYVTLMLQVHVYVYLCVLVSYPDGFIKHNKGTFVHMVHVHSCAVRMEYFDPRSLLKGTIQQPHVIDST